MAYNRPTPEDTEQPTFDRQPPDVYAECRKVLARHQANRGRWPAMMDRNFEMAARWWVDQMQEPYDDAFERPKLVATFGNNSGERWQSPYQDRVANNLRTFLDMPHDRQRYVVSAREEGYWWRGEYEDVWKKGEDGVKRKHWLFHLVVAQYELQREMGKEKYAEMARKRLHAFMGKAKYPAKGAREKEGLRRLGRG